MIIRMNKDQVKLCFSNIKLCQIMIRRNENPYTYLFENVNIRLCDE